MATFEVRVWIPDRPGALGEVASSFLEGSRSSLVLPTAETGPGGVSWASVPASTLHLVLGRPGRPLRLRERRRLTALARIVGLRRSELARRRSFETHPSNLARIGN